MHLSSCPYSDRGGLLLCAWEGGGGKRRGIWRGKFIHSNLEFMIITDGAIKCIGWMDGSPGGVMYIEHSAGTLLKIYRRLIGRPYLSTRSAAPNISQYIGSTQQACNTSLQCIVEWYSMNITLQRKQQFTSAFFSSITFHFYFLLLQLIPKTISSNQSPTNHYTDKMTLESFLEPKA